MELLRCGMKERKTERGRGGDREREGEREGVERGRERERQRYISYYGSMQGVGWGLAGDLHGLGSGLVVQGPRGAALQQAVEVVAAATAVHGGDAGRGGGARASQTSHSCWRHWKRDTCISIPLMLHRDSVQCGNTRYPDATTISAYHANNSQIWKLIK